MFVGPSPGVCYPSSRLIPDKLLRLQRVSSGNQPDSLSPETIFISLTVQTQRMQGRPLCRFRRTQYSIACPQGVHLLLGEQEPLSLLRVKVKGNKIDVGSFKHNECREDPFVVFAKHNPPSRVHLLLGEKEPLSLPEFKVKGSIAAGVFLNPLPLVETLYLLVTARRSLASKDVCQRLIFVEHLNDDFLV